MVTNKRVYFIRHCQSKNNEQTGSLIEVAAAIAGLKLPSIDKIRRACQIFDYVYDCDVTELGLDQVLDLSTILHKGDFWTDIDGPFAIVHSSLIRAKKTCFKLIETSNFAQKPATVISTDFLVEATIIEHFMFESLDSRINHFERWLDTLDFPTVIVVGHGMYFRRMLGYNEEIMNCDVISAIFERDYRWKDVKLIYRTPLSSFVTLPERSTSSNPSNPFRQPCNGQMPNQIFEDDDKTCRICHMTASETPNMKLIHPCLCSGSLSHVHLACLNQWRATSSSAQYICAVCKYEYKIKKSIMATFLLSGYGSVVVCACFMLLSVFLLGTIFQYLFSNVLQIDIFQYMYQYTYYIPMWQIIDCDEDEISLLWSRWNMKSTSGEKLYTRLLSKFQIIKYAMYCKIAATASLSSCLEISLIGFVALGLIGVFWFVIEDIINVTDLFIRRIELDLHHNSVRRLLGIFSWWASSGAIDASKFLIYLGLLLGTREIYNKSNEISRRISHWIGEQIVETNSG